MNILYIEHYAGSPEMGMEFRPYYLSQEWLKMGHKVSIIAGDYSHLRKINPIIEKDMENQNSDGIDYYWLKTGTYEGNGIARALTMFRFCYKLIKWKKWIKSHIDPDVIISSSTYPLDAIPTHFLAKGKKKAKHIHEVHDMWPSTLIEIGGMSRYHPFVLLMQFGENFAYRHADAVVSLPRYAKEYMMQHGLPENHFYHIPNGIVKEEWSNPIQLPEEHKEHLERLKQEGKFVVGYFGGHALSNCLMTLVQAAEKIENDNVHIVLVGAGVEKENLVQYAKEKNIKNISFLLPVNKKAIPTLTEYFDCIYIGAKDSPLYRFGACMNKMFDGMMAGKPIIFAINAPPTPVDESKCGIIINPEKASEIVMAINQLYKLSDSERRILGEHGKEMVIEKYTYEVLAQEFINVMYGES